MTQERPWARAATPVSHPVPLPCSSLWALHYTCGPTICCRSHPRLSHTAHPRHTTSSLYHLCLPHTPQALQHHFMPRTLLLICLGTLWVPAAHSPIASCGPSSRHLCCAHRVRRMASGNLWPRECPRSPLRFVSSTRISSRKPPSPSSDCPSTMASWAVG